MSSNLPLDYYDLQINPKEAVIIGTEIDHVEIKATDVKAQVLFMSSIRLDEPVAWGGPIVMNSKEELNKAFDDLRKGTFLRDKISY
jgi:redox-sensitive bicupin YhaK (pirin superfamily)